MGLVPQILRYSRSALRRNPLARPRSSAARQASRRNGAKSKGPRTRAGKAISARNALRHGLRARSSIRPEDLPAWIRAIEADLLTSLDPLGHARREQLDRLLSVLLLLDRADRAIIAQLARVHAVFGAGAPGEEEPLADQADIATLRKLFAYRKRFRARRDMCLKRIIRPD